MCMFLTKLSETDSMTVRHPLVGPVTNSGILWWMPIELHGAKLTAQVPLKDITPPCTWVAQDTLEVILLGSGSPPLENKRTDTGPVFGRCPVQLSFCILQNLETAERQQIFLQQHIYNVLSWRSWTTCANWMYWRYCLTPPVVIRMPTKRRT